MSTDERRPSSPLDEKLSTDANSRYAVADPALVEKFRRLLTGQEKGYAGTAWQELARVAAKHYPPTANGRRLLSASDYLLLIRLLRYVADHGGGSGPWPECEINACASCQAVHLIEQLS